MSEQQHRIANFRRARDWVPESGGDLFPTYGSFEWFVRRHRAELVGSGQLIVRRGTGGSLVGPDLDRVVLDILQREAAQAIDLGGDAA